MHRLDPTTLDTDIPTPSTMSTPDAWRKPWLVASMDVNALNFCSVATLGSNLIAVPGTLDSDTVWLF